MVWLGDSYEGHDLWIDRHFWEVLIGMILALFILGIAIGYRIAPTEQTFWWPTMRLPNNERSQTEPSTRI